MSIARLVVTAVKIEGRTKAEVSRDSSDSLFLETTERVHLAHLALASSSANREVPEVRGDGNDDHDDPDRRSDPVRR